MSDVPSKERTRDLLINWRRWALDCPKDPAEIYYYTECFCFSERMTVKEVKENRMTIKYLYKPIEINEFWNPPKTAPVVVLTAEEYEREK